MLKSLQIKNFALIDSLDVEFTGGLNIITGETGAGKSIIVDALMMLLGERGNTDLIREGEQRSVIEGIFELNESHPVFAKMQNDGYESFGEEIIIRREIRRKGASRCFLNDSPIPVSELKNFGDILVDFHGQHDHQSLLKPKNHLDILDSAGNYSKLISEFKSVRNDLLSLIHDHNELLDKKQNILEKEEYQRQQLQEINKVNPLPEEDSELESELKIKENYEQLFNSTAQLFDVLYDGSDSVHDKLTAAQKLLEDLAAIDGSFSDFINELNAATITVDEIAKFANDYNSGMEFDPDKIEKIRLRLQELKGIMKKYGPVHSIIEKKDILEKELSLIENFDDEINKIKKKIIEKQEELGHIAGEISMHRLNSAKSMEKSIQEKLHFLGIETAVFRININQEEIDPKSSDPETIACAKSGNKYYKAFSNGIDEVRFFISLNKGESPKPLAEIASGGEISRVMLSIKSIAAEAEGLPMLIFDEIDTGVSGRISQKVGLTMKELAKYHQIIAITHQPQIAALADRNISVRKIEKKSRTYIHAEFLADEDRIAEIAKLISGEKVTEASLKSAAELINFAG